MLKCFSSTSQIYKTGNYALFREDLLKKIADITYTQELKNRKSGSTENINNSLVKKKKNSIKKKLFFFTNFFLFLISKKKKDKTIAGQLLDLSQMHEKLQQQAPLRNKM